MMVTCMTGMTLLVGITGKPFLSSTTDVTSWPPSLNRIFIIIIVMLVMMQEITQIIVFLCTFKGINQPPHNMSSLLEMLINLN